MYGIILRKNIWDSSLRVLHPQIRGTGIFSESFMKWVFLFESVHRVMKAEKLLKGKGLKIDLIPVPREINSDCGVAIEVDEGIGEEALLLLGNSNIGVLECYTKNSSGRFKRRDQKLIDGDRIDL